MKILLVITTFLLFFSSCIHVSNTNSFLSQDFKGDFNNVLILTETNDNLNISSVAKELNTNFLQRGLRSDLLSIPLLDDTYPTELNNLSENIKYILIMQRFGGNTAEINIGLKLFEKATKKRVWESHIAHSNSNISFTTSQIISLMDKIEFLHLIDFCLKNKAAIPLSIAACFYHFMAELEFCFTLIIQF